MSYYSPYSQWPAGFLIHFSDYFNTQIRFSTAALSPKYVNEEAIHFNNFIDISVNIQGGKQDDNARPTATTIIGY